VIGENGFEQVDKASELAGIATHFVDGMRQNALEYLCAPTAARAAA
jgi:hypothetical protein